MTQDTSTRTAALTPRAVLITHTLRLHGTTTDRVCHCGYEYTPDESIAVHQADAIDAALSIVERGVPLDDVIEAVDTAHDLASRRHDDTRHHP